MLCLRECACISQYISTPHSSVSLLIIVLVYQIDGYVSRITVRYCRFRSLPVSDERVLPTTTPSGFSIGINLNINLWRNFFATNESLVMKSIRPFIIHDDGVSPGCTRALTTIARFFCFRLTQRQSPKQNEEEKKRERQKREKEIKVKQTSIGVNKKWENVSYLFYTMIRPNLCILVLRWWRRCHREIINIIAG